MNRWWILAACVVAGALALGLLFPRYDLTTQAFRLSVNRARAIQLLQQEAARHGVDTTGWDVALTSSLVDRTINLRASFPDAPAVQAFTGAHLRAMATSPSGGKVEASFFADGRAEYFESSLSQAAIPPEKELAHFVGADAAHFIPVTRGAASREGTQYTWEWTDPTQPGIVARFESLQRDGKAIRSNYSLSISDQTAELARVKNHRLDLDALTTLGSFLIFSGITLACWVFFRSLTQRTDHIRFPLSFILILLALTALPFLARVRNDAAVLNPSETAISGAGLLVGAVLAGLFGVLLNYVLLAAGYATLPEPERPSWTGLQLISKSRFLSCRVGVELLAGMLAGIPLLAFLFVGAFLFDRVARLYGIGYLMSRAPLLSPLDGLNQFDVIGIFAMLLPVCVRYLRPAWFSWLTISAIGILFVTAIRRPFETDAWIDLSAGGAVFAGLFLVYRYFGLLATLVAGISMAAVHHALSFGFQPDPSLAINGLGVAGLYGTAVLASGALAFWGRRYDEVALEQEMAPRESDVSRSESGRLQADFALARRAQQNLLPAAPPRVPGLDIAATCRPALEVGGDLFDFPRLADGRTAFCVADVSGKGVPAAIYMTLTTGILAAAARRSQDVRDIVNQLNRHLHTACRHRTFVTLSLGVWDESMRRFEHVRAGHNPLLHRPASGPARYVQPSGLGLGLVRAGSFERALETHTLDLALGDVLVLYSDGLVEAMNPALEQFGEDRLKQVVEACHTTDAALIQSRVLEAVDRFTAGAEPHDDMTIMVLAAVPTS